MKYRVLLFKLDQQLVALTTELAPIKDNQTLHPRFDRQLFSNGSTRMADYLAEALQSYQRLQAACDQGDSDKVAWLAGHLSNQIVALRREGATWQLRAADGAHLYSGQLHQDILRHQVYEQRLLAMVIERENRLANVTTFMGQQQCQREVDVYRQRLARCRQALDALNRRLAIISR